MKNKKTLFIILFIFLLLMVGAAILYRQLGQKIVPEQLVTQESQKAEEDKTDETQQNTKAPDFIVYDEEGNEVHLTDFFGKPIVLNFWASWCGPCQMEMPDFHEKYLELGENVQFLMINMTDGSRETVEIASAFIAEHEYTFQVFYDTQSNAASVYGIHSLPTTFFIDKDGYAVAQATGAIDEETLQRGIDLVSE